MASALSIRLDENGIMLRPTRHDECVRRRAAELALPELKHWLRFGENDNEADLIEALTKVIDGSDGYQIARALERDGWCSDSSLVEILDGDFVSDALRELVAQWEMCVGSKSGHQNARCA